MSLETIVPATPTACKEETEEAPEALPLYFVSFIACSLRIFRIDVRAVACENRRRDKDVRSEERQAIIDENCEADVVACKCGMQIMLSKPIWMTN